MSSKKAPARIRKGGGCGSAERANLAGANRGVCWLNPASEELD